MLLPISRQYLTPDSFDSAGRLIDQAAVAEAAAAGPPPATPYIVARYPLDIGSPPHEKQILFEVKKGRHLGRRGNVAEGNAKDETIACATLYMPVDALNTTTAVDWTPEDIGIVGGAMIQAFTTGAQVTRENLLEKLKDTALSGAGGIAIDLAAKMIIPLISTVTGGGNGKAILQSMFGQQIDPRTDMLFNKVQYRTHTFTFTLIPRNQDEAEDINKILNMFQFYMLPKYGGAEGDLSLDSYFIGYPYEFDITLITGGGGIAISKSPHINKIDRSVLTSCAINHASSQRVAFVGSYYPASTSLVLDFTEVRLQGRDNYGGEDGVMWHGSPATPDDPNSPTSIHDIGEMLGVNTGHNPARTMHLPGTEG